MEILKSKALDNIMYREYYGLLAWNETQADRPIDCFNQEWLQRNVYIRKDYLLKVLERVDNDLSKEHAALLALVLVEFYFILAAYYLALYFDDNKEYVKALKYYQMSMVDKEIQKKVQERYNQLEAFLSFKTSYLDQYISKYRIKDFIKFWKSNDNLDNSVNDIYINIGKETSQMDSEYKQIYFYEDLFEHLIKSYDLRFSKILTNYICNGKFEAFPFKEELSSNFIKWAKGVKKLSSRSYFIVEYSELYSIYLKAIGDNVDENLLLKEVKDMITYNGRASINSIMQICNIGYNRTFKILEKLEKQDFLIKVKNTYRYLKL